MLVYCEIPYYLLLSNAESYKTSIKEELKEMIRQGYNHPSIMMWGIENEVYQPASAAAFGKDFQINENTLVSFNSSVAKLAQKEDTTRYIVQAQIDSSNANKVCAKWSKNGNVDYTGVNLYVGFKSSVSSADDEGRKVDGPHQICIGIQTAAAPSFPVIPKVFDALVFFSDAPDPVISPVTENRPVSVGIFCDI